jgi:ribosomal protein S18 acetylase RimI-like enzyme
MKKKLNNVECRLIEEKDFKSVNKIYGETFFAGGDPDELKDRIGRAVVAVKGKKVLGFAFFDIEPDGRGQAMYIANVGVSPRTRSRGVCGLMVGHLAKKIRTYRCKYAYLNVFEDNEYARRCYSRIGFKAVDDGGMIRMEFRPKRKKSKKRKSKKTAA